MGQKVFEIFVSVLLIKINIFFYIEEIYLEKIGINSFRNLSMNDRNNNCNNYLVWNLKNYKKIHGDSENLFDLFLKEMFEPQQ